MTRKARLLWVVALVLLWLFCTGAAHAGELGDRLSQFPTWQSKPAVQVAEGDLVYPDWFAGDWTVTTTLVELSAPLAPDLVTPGFESNQAYLNQPIVFQARFARRPTERRRWLVPLRTEVGSSRPSVVADRAFNGLNLARAYLKQALGEEGDRRVQSVRVDPTNPNRQVTQMQGDRQLVSTVTGRLTETPDAYHFLTTEISQQIFQGISQPYLNEVETTTAYSYHPDEPIRMTADQVTAVYLSPQDPDFFKAGDRPLALYRYRLEFVPAL